MVDNVKIYILHEGIINLLHHIIRNVRLFCNGNAHVPHFPSGEITKFLKNCYAIAMALFRVHVGLVLSLLTLVIGAILPAPVLRPEVIPAQSP